MKISLCLLFVFWLVACNQLDISNAKATNKPNDSKLRESIIGKWGGSDRKIPVLEITKDSIHYFQRSTSYHYKILNDDIVFSMPDHQVIFKKIHVVNDTLIFSHPTTGVTVEAYRVKD